MTHILLTVPKPPKIMALQTTSTYQPTTNFSPPQLAPFPPGTAVDQEIAEASVRNIHLNSGSLPPPHPAKMSTIAATTLSEHPSEHPATCFYGVPLAARGSKLTHRVSFSRGSVSKRFPPRRKLQPGSHSASHERLSRRRLAACLSNSGEKKRMLGNVFFFSPH